MTKHAGDAAAGHAPSRPPGQAMIAGIVIGLLTALTQIVLRRALAPGEFGTLNALLGLALILVVPLGAFAFVLRRALTGAQLANLLPPLLNRAALVWSFFCLVLLFVSLPVLQLPRSSLEYCMLLTVGAGLFAICGRPVTPAKWCAIIGIGAAVVRLIVSAWMGGTWRMAESGLVAFALAGLLAGLPALSDRPETPPLSSAWPALRSALVPGLATLSVALALVLFTNADRVAAQPLLGTSDPGQYVNLKLAQINGYPFPGGEPLNSYVDYRQFDDYEAAGLCGRGLLIAVFPVLLLLYRQRAALNRTTIPSLRWFWIYLGLLLTGSIALVFSAPLIAVLFHSSSDLPLGPSGRSIPDIVPGFAAACFVIGLLHAFGIFALASRRHVECFVLGACSIGYTFFLFDASRAPQIITACMFGGALISLMAVLFAGVVRYARTHP